MAVELLVYRALRFQIDTHIRYLLAHHSYNAEDVIL